MFTQDVLHHVQLHPALDVGILHFSNTDGLDLHCHFFDNGQLTFDAAQPRIVLDFQGLSPIQNIRNIKILSVVTSDNVRIELYNEVSPPVK